jgi:RimJ/RimL family protein N-acetyltransferase
MLVIESPRLMLRHFEHDDLEPLAALYGDPEIRRYYPDGVLSRDQTREELEWFRNGHPDPGAGTLGDDPQTHGTTHRPMRIASVDARGPR